jgi:hypothetical protein
MTLKTPDRPAAPDSLADDGYQARKWRFDAREDVVRHVSKLLGVASEGPSALRIRSGQLSDNARRILAAARDAPERRVRFDHPVFNLITTNDGMIEVGGQLHDFNAIAGNARRTAGPDAVFALVCEFDPASGFQICRSEDGSRIEYRSGDDKIVFKTFFSNYLVGWKMGVRIDTDGPDFQAARIDSRYYYTALAQTCAPDSDSDEDFNDDDLEESSSGTFLSEKPIRLQALCRAQWKGRRIAGIVTRGAPCLDVAPNPLPEGFPDNWPPLPVPGEILIDPASLLLLSRPERPTATARITIRNTHDDAREVTVGVIAKKPQQGPVASAQGTFGNTTGQFSMLPGSAIQIAVSYTGQSGFGTVEGELPVSFDGGTRRVPVTGRTLEVLAPIG